MDSLLASSGQMYNLACEPAPSLYSPPPLARHVTRQMAGRVCTSMSPWLPQKEGGGVWGGQNRLHFIGPFDGVAGPEHQNNHSNTADPLAANRLAAWWKGEGEQERKQMGHVIAGRVQLRRDPEEGAKGERRLVGERAPLICSRRGHGELFPLLQ